MSICSNNSYSNSNNDIMMMMMMMMIIIIIVQRQSGAFLSAAFFCSNLLSLFLRVPHYRLVCGPGEGGPGEEWVGGGTPLNYRFVPPFEVSFSG